MIGNTVVVLPSLNPDYRLNLVVDGVLKEGFKNIIIVNDGSDEEHLEPFRTAAEHSEVTVLTHEVNKGKGRGLKTAFEYVLTNFPECTGVVTIDGDNQHAPEDIKKCVEQMETTGSVVLGCRDFGLDNVPWKSKAGNNITKFVFRVFCGIKVSDTQTGLRAIPFKYLNDMIQTEGERFEYETNMLLEIHSRNIPMTEVKIQTLYEDIENSTSHFNPFKDSLKIYKVIFKYLLSSGIASIVDLIVFFLMNLLLTKLITSGFTLLGHEFEIDWAITFGATLGARVVSSFVNYRINKKVVFKSDAKGTLWKYYLLVVAQLTVSASLVSILSVLFSAGSLLRTICKCIVDFCLFFVTFRVQRAWVFKEKK
ncbi:MAG: bifunctional glycosyltransferase family 2/GtrA family protein [Lachnospiraceae bacterium]|nr:bifunctional glycosyltransferase family 2/GtrA family protein [Lachnospiraceae bacterium]